MPDKPVPNLPWMFHFVELWPSTDQSSPVAPIRNNATFEVHIKEYSYIFCQGDVQSFIIKFCGKQMHSNTTKNVQHRIFVQDTGNGDLFYSAAD